MWRESDSPLSLWFITGGGGFGKTRLAVEASLEAERAGWTTGLLDLDADNAALADLADWPGRLLLVVDYAETRPSAQRDSQSDAGRAALDHRSGCCCWFAGAHPAPSWLRTSMRVARTAFRLLLHQASLSRLEDDEIERLELFDRGLETFARLLGREDLVATQPRPRLRRVLRSAAVRTGRRVPGRCRPRARHRCAGRAGPVAHLVREHEAAYWSRWADRRNLDLDVEDQRTAVGLATLLTAASEAEALSVVGLIPHFASEPATRRLAVARWLARLYHPQADETVLQLWPLEPDRLGEVLVGDVLSSHRNCSVRRSTGRRRASASGS